MKKILSLLIILFVAGNLFAQGQSQTHPLPPTFPGERSKSTKVGDQWTLLSDKDNLVFESKRGACNGHGLLMVKVQNKTGKEVHVFVSLSLKDGMRTPQQLLVLKANQSVEIGCRPNVPFMSIPLRDNQQQVEVDLEYHINKQL